MVWHNGDLWLYGGVSAVESVLSDVWRFDPTTYVALSASDASAGARAFHSLFSLDLGLTIFAGTGNGAIAGSTWSATSEALDWSVVPLQDTPSVRRGASLFAVGQNRLWLAGGVGTSGAPKVDVWKATVSADATDWEQFQPPFPATLDSAVAYRPDTEVIYIHGKDTDGTSVSELWSWSPVSGPVITSRGLPTASQHAMVWDAAGSRLLGHHAGLLWSWDADTDDFGALPTNGDVPTTAVGQRLFLTDDGTTLYLFDSLQSTLWSLQVASGYWSVVATGLEISASAPMWMVGDELVGVSERSAAHLRNYQGNRYQVRE